MSTPIISARFLLVALVCAAAAFNACALKMQMSSNPFSFSGLFPSAKSSSSTQKVIAITGASGLVGSAVKAMLENKYNAKVISISRKAAKGDDDAITWNPSANTISDNAIALLSGADAVIHLAGEGVASGEGPLAILGTWSASKKTKILDSRVDGTKLIVDTIKQLPKKPHMFISASGVGFYGYKDSATVFDESSGIGDGFLADVVEAWEAEALKAPVRTVCIRLAPVFSAKAGILAKLTPLFNLAAGGVIGTGQQGFSWVTLSDTVRAIEFLLFDKKAQSLKGSVNVCTPTPTDNAGFTSSMGEALGRPTVVPLPEFVAGTVFGEMGQEMLLGGQKVLPTRLLKAGFKFEDTDLVEAIKANV